ncbi:MAG TPA: hypothetical protein VKG05_04605 [Steroidobacteraceae bacterium]|nr:hypothetical protein [Steroidobacteraceae bacterium]
MCGSDAASSGWPVSVAASDVEARNILHRHRLQFMSFHVSSRDSIKRTHSPFSER